MTHGQTTAPQDKTRMVTEPIPTTPPESPQGSVAKHASIYFLGQTVSWLANIIVLSSIPRALGESAMGQFAFAFNLVTVISLCVMLGGEMYLTVEVGRNRVEAARYVGAMLGLRLVLYPVFLIACLVTFALAKDMNAGLWHMAFVFIVAFLITLVSDPLRAVMVGLQDSKRVAVFDLIFTLFPLLTLPFLRYGVITQAVIFLISSIVVFLLRLYVVGKLLPLRPRFEPALWKRIIVGGFPYQANNMILQLYSVVSIVVFRHYADYATLGVYSQAQRLFSAFLFVPNALGMALLPSLARMADASKEQFRDTQSRVLILLIVISLPVTAAVFFMSDAISHFLYGPAKYVDMPLVLKVYAFAIAPIYIVSTMYQFLVAQKRGAIWTGFLLTSVALFAVFAALLIPYTLRVYHSGATGGVAATVLAELCSACFALALLGNNPFNRETVRQIGCAVVAAGAMSAVLWLTRSWFPLLSLSLGLIVFALLAWRLHILAPEEKELIVNLIRRLRRQS